MPWFRSISIIFLFSNVSLFWAQSSVSLVGELPELVNETSGLIFYNGKLITHNDSGNSAELFEIDTVSLEVTRVIQIQNALNHDWEDITQDNSYIYIGDIGNNNGDRTDLAIYRIRKSDFDSSESVPAERIGFAYEDQLSFNPGDNSDWDAEALTIMHGQLTVFTKEWQRNGSTAYAIPNTPGDHIAINLGSSPATGLITAATYNELTNILYLLGYSSQLQPFLIRFADPPGPFSFGGTGEKNDLGIGFAQAEGIGFVDENTYYITSERFQNETPSILLPARLYRLSTGDVIPLPTPPREDPIPPEPIPDPEPEEEVKDELVLFREFGSDMLQYQLDIEDDLFGVAIFDVSGRLLHYEHVSQINENSIDISSYKNSVYFLTLFTRKKIITKAFIAD